MAERRKTYGEKTVVVSSLIRETTRDEVTAIAEEQGRTLSRVMADAIEMYVAAIRGEAFEPRVLGVEPDLQMDLLDVA